MMMVIFRLILIIITIVVVVVLTYIDQTKMTLIMSKQSSYNHHIVSIQRSYNHHTISQNHCTICFTIFVQSSYNIFTVVIQSLYNHLTIIMQVIAVLAQAVFVSKPGLCVAPVCWTPSVRVGNLVGEVTKVLNMKHFDQHA